ncbi:butyrate kinase [Labilibaculum euxinus]|uniref:Probable butyrate kinase n=1 Tax=Labilibaculum euxinus TaxID=2686357 RepID=A0A7M4DA43_9BACT|nr:butyrate kinase [Labilibaculum euxinus]MUP39522.1 butyrate kinase [Labilibaculum euxinus]MVB08727.1 butyrate kinase [Labilibaculum euxinus]
MSRELILALNPRMQFTRIAVYRMNSPVFLKKINHKPEEIGDFKCFCDQTKFRAKVIMDELKANDISIDEIKVIIGRGGLIKPVKSGVYRVNEAMIKDLSNCEFGNDVVNLSGLLAYTISEQIDGAEAFVADPVVVDELEDIARITGRPEFKKRSIFHALDQKTSARKYAQSIYKKYEELNLIIAHLGGGISIGAHKKGRVVDSNQAYDGDGPFSPIRSGSLPMGEMIQMCFSGKYTQEEMMKMQTGEGGLYAYFNTYSGYDVCRMRDAGDSKAKEVLSAMAYQVAKSIGSMYPVFGVDAVDAIIITGGMAKDETLVKEIRGRVEKIAPVIIYPGAEVLGALSDYGRMILRNETEILDY